MTEYFAYQYKKATGWLIVTFVCDIICPLLAFIFGMYVYLATVNLDGEPEPKYIVTHRYLGLTGVIFSLPSIFFGLVKMVITIKTLL